MTNELQHYGVKGMRWGVRKSEGSRSERKAKRKARNEEIKEARYQLIKGKHSKDISKAEIAYYEASGKSGEARAKRTLEKYAKENVRLQELAGQRTSGEKWTQGVIGTSMMAVGLGMMYQANKIGR